MMTWIALAAIALALGAVAAVVSSRRVRTFRDELLEDALPSARTGESAGARDRLEPGGPPTARRDDWGLRWAEVTNLTPAGPDRPSGKAPARDRARDTTAARS
jgi:hypothetical protein